MTKDDFAFPTRSLTSAVAAELQYLDDRRDHDTNAAPMASTRSHKVVQFDRLARDDLMAIPVEFVAGAYSDQRQAINTDARTSCGQSCGEVSGAKGRLRIAAQSTV